MTVAPTLTTERLVLRSHRLDDLDDYIALWRDESVVRYIGGRKLEQHECWARIMRFTGMWTLLGYGFWIIEDRATGAFLGEAGVMDAKRIIEPTLAGTLEAGWVMAAPARGKGMAFEAMSAVLDWTDATYPDVKQSCIIQEGNAASVKLAERLGFREVAHSDLTGTPMIQFRRTPAKR
jgi:RimJ/RimL family protein N-acetyltransferase